MKDYKILFPIETAGRELVYKLVLSAKFAQIGYECYLGSKDEMNQLLKYIKPVAYFDKGYHAKVSERIYDAIKKNMGVIINLDEEGGVDFKDSSTISARYPDKVFQICDLILLWGTNQYNFLKNIRGHFNEGKVVVSGHPRFDLLKQSFHGLYENERKAIGDRFKKYILINTNMGFGNNIWGDSFVRENYEARIKNINSIIDFDKIKIKRYISFIKKLSPLYNDNIILRPHPEENKDTYISTFKEFKNVKVIFEGSVIPWILEAEVMIHPDCTTGIESLMLGKKAISFLPGYKDDRATHLPVILSHQCNNEDELINLILDRKYPSQEDVTDPLLNEYFSFDKNSNDIVVEKVNDLLSNQRLKILKTLPRYYPMKRWIKEKIKPYYYRLMNKDIKLFQNKLSGLNPSSVKTIFDKVISVFGMNGKVSIQCINSSLYRIIGTMK
jgi:surface carbohydrate biosynthesis protein